MMPTSNIGEILMPFNPNIEMTPIGYNMMKIKMIFERFVAIKYKNQAFIVIIIITEKLQNFGYLIGERRM